MESQSAINSMAVSAIPMSSVNATVPIVLLQDGSLSQHGTGTLFRIADAFFLVTAAHVFRLARQYALSIGFGAAINGSFIPIRGRHLESRPKYADDDSDVCDIAIYPILSEDVSHIEKDRFLSLVDVDCGSQSPTAVYSICGFPCKWSKTSRTADEKVVLKAIQYTSYSYSGDTSAFVGYVADRHLLISANVDETTDDKGDAVRFVDFVGDALTFPKQLSGISGSSVWRIGDLNVPLSEWNSDHAKVVAVQTGVYQDKSVIKATRWSVVLEMLNRAFPELHPALSLWRG